MSARAVMDVSPLPTYVLALAFNALIGLLIATSLVPQFFLSPCV